MGNTTPGFRPTSATYRQGARTLPGDYYTRADVLAEEIARIFSRQWHCAGRVSAAGQPGDYFVSSVAGESIIIVRDGGGRLRAWFNVCRHRGTALCQNDRGRFTDNIRCPYHAWTYALDGRLVGAPHMHEVDGFDLADYPLQAAALAEWAGFVFVNVADRPDPFDRAYAPVIERLSRFNLDALAAGHRVTYEVKANWKLVFQNYSECLHCPMIHPELSTVLVPGSGANDFTEGPFLGGSLALSPPAESVTLSGRACGSPVAPDLPLEDRRHAFYYTLMPNLLLGVHPDYVNYYLVRPVAPDRTLVTSEWLFHPESRHRDDFRPDEAVGLWDATNRQDWDIIERSQLGVASRRYVPGPYSPRESIAAAWDREYLRLMKAPDDGPGQR